MRWRLRNHHHSRTGFQVEERSRGTCRRKKNKFKRLSNYYRLFTNIHGPGGVAARQGLLYCFSCISRRGRGTIGANNNNVAVRTVREARSVRWYSKQANPIPSHGHPPLNDDRIKSMLKVDNFTQANTKSDFPVLWWTHGDRKYLSIYDWFFVVIFLFYKYFFYGLHEQERFFYTDNFCCQILTVTISDWNTPPPPLYLQDDCENLWK